MSRRFTNRSATIKKRLLKNSATFLMLKQYEPCGHCVFCTRPLESIQPGGLAPRHLIDKVPYGQCEQAKRERERIE